jgi:hypothetical protein
VSHLFVVQSDYDWLWSCGVVLVIRNVLQDSFVVGTERLLYESTNNSRICTISTTLNENVSLMARVCAVLLNLTLEVLLNM